MLYAYGSLAQLKSDLGITDTTDDARLRRALELAAEQIDERLVCKLGLLQADDVRPALVQPRQQARYALLDRVHVPGRDSHPISR
jgi:hypothetical protein